MDQLETELEDVSLEELEEAIINLSNAADSFIIYKADVLKQKELLMTARDKKILDTYPLRIWETADGKWRAHIPDPTKAEGRRLIQGKTRENLEKNIIEDYERKREARLQFHNCFIRWLMEYKAITVQPPTLQRYRDDFNRFINGTTFDKKDITDIKRSDIKKFVNEAIVKYRLSRKSLTNLMTIIRGVFDYSYEEEDIAVNPMVGLKILNTNIQSAPIKTSETEVFNEEEMDALIGYMYEHYTEHRPVVTLAILLNFQLGLRAGELCALRKEDVDFEKKKIRIDRMERSYRPIKLVNGELVADTTVHTITEGHTKANSNRLIDLSNEAISIIEEAIRVQEALNIESEYIFAADNGDHIIRQRLNDCITYYCNKVSIDPKSSHKIRKTVISSLFSKGFDFEEIMLLAGHHNRQTTYKHYLFSVRMASERQKRLTEALSTGHTFGQPKIDQSQPACR